MSLLRRLLGGYSRRRRSHPVFGDLRFFDLADAKRYWEGSAPVPGASDDVALAIDAGPDGPTPAQVEFFQRLTADLDSLFERCRPALVAEWERWNGRAFPDDWRSDLTLAAIGIPAEGDTRLPWTVSFDSRADPEHMFTVYFEEGEPVSVTVDG